VFHITGDLFKYVKDGYSLTSLAKSVLMK
jgi:hypothetical protein